VKVKLPTGELSKKEGQNETRKTKQNKKETKQLYKARLLIAKVHLMY